MSNQRAVNRSEALGRRLRVGPVLLFILAACVGAVAQVSGPGQPLTDSTIARLKAQIASDDVEAKRSALFEIRNYGSAEASQLALPALKDKNEMVRSTAAASVVFLSMTEAAQALLPLLSDKAEFVRREAAYALGQVGNPSSTSPLVSLLQRDKVNEVRSAAAVALGKIGDPEALTALVGVFRERSQEGNEFLRRSSARAIGQIAQREQTGSTDVLTPQNFLPDKYKDLRSRPVWQDRQGINTGRVVVELSLVLDNNAESDDTRREAAFALGAIGDTSARPVLQKYSTSPDPYLAEICREALLKIERKMGS